MPERNACLETSCLDRLRESLSSLLPKLDKFKSHEWYLVKWLIEYEWDVQAAAKGFKKAEDWRSENSMDGILSEDLSEFKEKFPYNNDAVTKKGLPIMMVKFGKWNIREVVESGQKERFFRYALQMTDKSVDTLQKVVEKTNGVVTQVVFLFDLKGFSFRQLMSRQTVTIMSDWTRRSEEQYPQQLETFYVINAPKIMPLLFGLLKPFMSTNTVSRVQIFDSNEEVWRKALLENISGEQLAKYYDETKRGQPARF